MQDKNDERDDFWDLAKLVPKKKERLSPFSSKSVVSDYRVSGDESEKRTDTKLSFVDYAEATETSQKYYEPAAYPFIKSVTVKRFNDKYDFYGSFRKAAEVYYDYKTEKCDFAPYYSYMPQYSQLTREQKNYYFYFRDSVRHGNFIKSDYSYIYLLAYEILNLPDKIPPSEGIVLLCRLWKEYRTALRRIDPYFSIWVQDYCLVYGLKCPMDIIRDFIFDVIEVSSFKEFYLSDTEETASFGVDSMIAYLSDYDWRRGKYVEGEHSALYKKYMHGAMSRIISDVFGVGISKDRDAVTVNRDAFPHSLCTHAVKCKLVIEYYPVSRDASLRTIFTSAVRYTENRLRALIGIKSRLAVRELEPKYKNIIDGYFSELISSVQKKKDVRSVPEYESLYDAPGESISSSGADEIEKASWDTTFKLISEEEKNEISVEKHGQNESNLKNADELSETSDNVNTYGLCESDVEKIRLALDAGFSDDSAAERINEAFSDGFGDIILEMSGDLYIVIEDYREEIFEWLKQVK